MDRGHEMEAALIICTHTPRAVDRRLADLQTLAEFHLLHRAIETIEDTYFDTPDRSLQARLVSLRVRRINAPCF